MGAGVGDRQASRLDVDGQLMIFSNKPPIYTNEIIYIYKAADGKLYTSITIPKRLRKSLLTVDLTVATTPDQYISNYSGNTITVAGAQSVYQIDVFLQPGNQTHIFGKVESHFSGIVPLNGDYHIDIQWPLVNDEFKFTFSLLLLLQEFNRPIS
ncbi:MAG: hypothetical protein GuTV1_gp4 [Guiyang tombus-like virus 1]|nr:MAG: hypothetical protein GuTV1_gp4 [Guiyang tombus-like virus 1]